MRLLCCLLGLLTLNKVAAIQDESILIIGGGLSGLGAALELEKHGYSTTLVEATGRLGGRVSSLSPHVELGGTYLHGSNTSLALLLKHYKLPTIVSGGASAHPGKESAVWSYNGSVLNKTATEERGTALHKSWLERMQAELKKYSCTDENVETVRQNVQQLSDKVVANLTSTSSLDRALLEFELVMGFEHDLGVPFSHVSLDGFQNNWDWIDHSGPDLVVRDGLSTLINALREDIQGEILLNSPVERISYSNGTCTLTLANSSRELTSSACVVTIPLGVLKKHHATLFDPSLPRPKQDALQRAGVAAYNTLVLAWNRPVCQAGAYYPLSSSTENDNPLHTGFVCPHVLRSHSTIQSNVTQFYISGSLYDFENATFWKQHAVEIINQVSLAKDRIVSVTDIVNFTISTWHVDPYTLGSYSAPTTLTRGNVDRAILQSSLNGVVYFAGEHTNTCGRYQSLDGAYDSGIVAARQVVSHFESVGKTRQQQCPFQSAPQTCDDNASMEMATT